MGDFIVSARKYRPSNFDSVVGQEAITSTLNNAIASNQLAHAYLFCGPRGVGKTTCARIFAKVINGGDETTDYSFNIFELDAASNNSVDDIRNLTDQVRIPPQTGTYKVYIIDEVHMLSAAAFNAFLKTLEEPPPHAIFILATTEKHKILATILSRCQVFDFNRIQVQDIANHLASIAQKEGLSAEPDALHLIAQKADGALRDGLSIFDQLVSFTGGNLSYESVVKSLNILDYDYYFRITEMLIQGAIPSSLLLFNEILEKGFDGHHFINGLAQHLRDLLVCRDPQTVALLEVGENIKQRYAEQARSCDEKLLLTALQICSKVDTQYKSSKHQRLLVELALMQLCSINTPAEKKTAELNETPVTILPPSATPESQLGKQPKVATEPQKQPGSEQASSIPTESVAPRVEQLIETEEQPDHTPESKHLPEELPQESNKVEEVDAQHSERPPLQDIQSDNQSENNLEPEQEVPTITEEIQAGENEESPQETQPVVAKPPAVIEPPTDTSQEPSIPSVSSSEAQTHGSISIAAVLQGNVPINPKAEEEEQSEPDLTRKPMDRFTTDDMLAAWKEYASQLKLQGKGSLHSALTRRDPELKENETITIVLDNNVQAEELTIEKTELLAYLRQRLKNYSVQLEASVVEAQKENKLYTNRDKFEHMAKKNPNLEKLRQDLDLELDF